MNFGYCRLSDNCEYYYVRSAVGKSNRKLHSIHVLVPVLTLSHAEYVKLNIAVRVHCTDRMWIVDRILEILAVCLKT
jgi:hypothetical protein